MSNQEHKFSPADNSSISHFPHQIFQGSTWHSRLLPSVHKFTYPYRYWGINISALIAGQTLLEVNGSSSSDNKGLNKLPFQETLLRQVALFSAKHKALQQFYPNDYLQSADFSKSNDETAETKQLDEIAALSQRLSSAFIQQTGSAPLGDMVALVVCRNMGLYFSPVNFYLGFDKLQTPTHLLAEVSNTPWDKRHYYGFLLEGQETSFSHDKNFHVSPFNPIDQLYRWQVSIKSDNDLPNRTLEVRIAINISDKRGEVLKTGVKMTGEIMTTASIKESLKRNPLMNITSLLRIYGHAFKLYAIKKVPYVNYNEKLADSDQG